MYKKNIIEPGCNNYIAPKIKKMRFYPFAPVLPVLLKLYNFFDKK